jgi:hypothetical protein
LGQRGKALKGPAANIEDKLVTVAKFHPPEGSRLFRGAFGMPVPQAVTRISSLARFSVPGK